MCASVLLAVLVSGVTASSVMAFDPSAVTDGATNYPGQGLNVWTGGGTPPTVDPGLPAGYANTKASEFAAFVSGKPLQVVHPTKKGSGAFMTNSGAIVTPLSACQSGYPCAVSITSYLPTKHEMRTTYCVVAFIQTIAVWDISATYGTFGSGRYGQGTQLGAQDQLAAEMGRQGTWDPYALSWINGKYKSVGYGFYYVPITPYDVNQFMGLIRFDLHALLPDQESNYVRVNLSNGGYGQWTTGGLHATGSAGYDDNAGTVTSYDPWSHRSGNAMCDSTYYSSTQTAGCFWTMSQGKYFQAMDTGSSGTLPLWY